MRSREIEFPDFCRGVAEVIAVADEGEAHGLMDVINSGTMFRNSSLLLIVAAFLISSCAPPAAPDTRAADEAAIRAMDEQWSATAAKNDLDGVVGYYSEDAVLLPPNAAIAKDAKSIRESWGGLLGPNTAVSWKVSKVEVARAGDIGYLYGTYQLTIKDPKGGIAVSDTGKIVEVWRKQVDGKWKCIVDTYNSDILMPASPEVKR